MPGDDDAITFLYVLLAIFIFGVLILVHELGHYITARLFDVHIEQFAIGMGPKLLSKKSKKTGIVYSLRALPIGGFVSMVGEDGESDDERAFCKKPTWQRIIIVAAGSVMNLLAGVILTFAVTLTSQNIGNTTIAGFDENAVSSQYGLRVGDEVVSVDGTRVHTANQLVYEVGRVTEGGVDMVVVRDGEEIVLNGVRFGVEAEEGISFGKRDFTVLAVEKSFGNVIKHTFYNSGLAVKTVWQSLLDLITGRYSFKAVSGPVGVTQAITDVAKTGTVNLLYLVSVIAMNLGVFNLLPIPALDGGKLFFLFFELLFRRPINRKVEGYIHAAGLIILLGFIAVVSIKDIIKLFG